MRYPIKLTDKSKFEFPLNTLMARSPFDLASIHNLLQVLPAAANPNKDGLQKCFQPYIAQDSEESMDI